MAASRSDPVRVVRPARGPVDPGARKRAVTALSLTAGALSLLWLGAPVCPTALFFGVPCPGCGLTRAAFALLSGDVKAALHFHPLAPLLVPLFVGAMVKATIDYVRGPRSSRGPSFWTRPAGVRIAVLLFVLVVGVWALRFAGYFGGPVPVTSLRDVRERLMQ